MCKKKNAGDKRRELLTVVVVNYLEVFDRGLGNAAVEVEHVGLGVVVPHRRLVVQLDEVVQRVTLPPAQEALLLLHTEIPSYKNTHCVEVERACCWIVKWQERDLISVLRTIPDSRFEASRGPARNSCSCPG